MPELPTTLEDGSLALEKDYCFLQKWYKGKILLHLPIPVTLGRGHRILLLCEQYAGMLLSSLYLEFQNKNFKLGGEALF